MNSAEIERAKQEAQSCIDVLTQAAATRKKALVKLDMFAAGLSDEERVALGLRDFQEAVNALWIHDEKMLENARSFQEWANNAVPNFSIEVFRSDDKIIHIQQACGEASGRWCTYASEESFMNNKKLCPECKRVFIMKQLAK